MTAFLYRCVHVLPILIARNGNKIKTFILEVLGLNLKQSDFCVAEEDMFKNMEVESFTFKRLVLWAVGVCHVLTR